MTPADLVLDGRSLSVDDVVRAARTPGTRLAVAPDALAALRASRAHVERAISGGRTVYGVNTGFGKLASVRIAPEQLDQLQVNLVRSHAAGVGAPLDAAVVRAVMLLRANVLIRSTSGGGFGRGGGFVSSLGDMTEEVRSCRTAP